MCNKKVSQTDRQTDTRSMHYAYRCECVQRIQSNGIPTCISGFITRINGSLFWTIRIIRYHKTFIYSHLVFVVITQHLYFSTVFHDVVF